MIVKLINKQVLSEKTIILTINVYYSTNCVHFYVICLNKFHDQATLYFANGARRINLRIHIFDFILNFT